MMRFVGAVVAVMLAVIACVTVPETQRKAFNFLPDSQMNGLGEQAYQEVLAKEKISKDPKANEIVTRIGQRIAKASGANYEWKFAVIDDPKTVNAFCLPGGKVAVYTGLFAVAKNEAALAAVMGHEVAHATAHHGAERMSQAITLQAGMVVADEALKSSGSRMPIMAALGLGAQVGVLLPYSRMHETEADKIGLVYMAKAGYDPHEAPLLWNRMGKTGGGGVPEFLSTHPGAANREKALQDQIPSVMGLYEQSEKQPSTAL